MIFLGDIVVPRRVRFSCTCFMGTWKQVLPLGTEVTVMQPVSLHSNVRSFLVVLQVLHPYSVGKNKRDFAKQFRLHVHCRSDCPAYCTRELPLHSNYSLCLLSGVMVQVGTLWSSQTTQSGHGGCWLLLGTRLLIPLSTRLPVGLPLLWREQRVQPTQLRSLPLSCTMWIPLILSS